MALVLVLGGLAVVFTREDGHSTVASSGPQIGAFTITAAPTGGLTYAPSELTVHTGLYDVTLKSGANSQHTLRFDDRSTRVRDLIVNHLGEEQTGRVFFGKPGDYTFFCVITGHRVAGMSGVVHVTGEPMTFEQAESGTN